MDPYLVYHFWSIDSVAVAETESKNDLSEISQIE